MVQPLPACEKEAGRLRSLVSPEGEVELVDLLELAAGGPAFPAVGSGICGHGLGQSTVSGKLDHLPLYLQAREASSTACRGTMLR